MNCLLQYAHEGALAPNPNHRKVRSQGVVWQPSTNEIGERFGVPSHIEPVLFEGNRLVGVVGGVTALDLFPSGSLRKTLWEMAYDRLPALKRSIATSG